MNDSRAVPVRPRLLLAGISLSLLTCFPFLMPREEIAAAMQEPPFPGQIGEWQGFRRYDFEISGNAVVVVAPQQAAPGNPWVWHGEFFGHKPAPDIALLQRGFHVVYLRVPDLLGCPTAVEHWNACYRVLTEQHGLAGHPRRWDRVRCERSSPRPPGAGHHLRAYFGDQCGPDTG